MDHPKLRFAAGIEIALLEVGKPPGMNKGDKRFRVAVEADGFRGEYDGVWDRCSRVNRFRERPTYP